MARESIRRAKLRKGKDESGFTTEALSKLIAGALPSRDLVNHDALVRSIVERIEAWRATKPQVGAHAEKLRKLVAIADKLNDAVEAAGAALLELGVDKEIEKVTAERVAIGIPPEEVRLGNCSVTIDLYLIPWQASDGLRKWNRMHRPGKHRPKEFGPALTADLQWLCRKVAGCSANEFERFLQPLNDSVEWKEAGLPILVQATLTKRAERGKKKRRTNSPPAVGSLSSMPRSTRIDKMTVIEVISFNGDSNHGCYQHSIASSPTDVHRITEGM